MKWMTYLAMTALLCSAAVSQETMLTPDTTISEEPPALPPWLGNYCISFFNKARSAKVLPEGMWQLSLKFQENDADQRETAQGEYGSLPAGQRKDMDKWTFCFKYGWAPNHQIAIGIPYFDNTFHYGAIRNSSSGVGNVFIFEKWNLIKETRTRPAVSVDFWYFLPNGDPDRMLGTDDDAYKVTAEVSKAWKDFSLHLNPGYKWNKKDGDNDEIEFNAAVQFTPDKIIWPVIEYNYLFKEGSGHSHDIVPGIIWKYRKGGSIKTALQFNIDSTFTFRDRVGMLFCVSQAF